MPADCKDAVTIITGGAAGIGEGIVRVFAQNGAKVIIADISVEAGTALAQELTTAGPGSAVFRQCNVRSEDDIKATVQFTVEKFGRIDCLVNNAGTHPATAPIDDFSSDDARSLFELNLLSQFLFCKYALPALRKNEGCIINMSSLVASIGQFGAATYVMTKAGIVGLTKALAVDEAVHNVRVNCISPGNIHTPLWDYFAKASGDYERTLAGGKTAQLNGRLGTIEEVGETALYLFGAKFVTGTDLLLSAGAELDYGNKYRGDRSGLYD